MQFDFRLTNQQQAVPIAPGIFYKGKPVVAVVQDKKTWSLLYMDGTTLRTAPTSPEKSDLRITGEWQLPPHQPVGPGTKLSNG